MSRNICSIVVGLVFVAMPIYASAGSPTLSGGGTFIRNSSLQLHSVVAVSIPGIKLKKQNVGVPQHPAGQVILTSLHQPGSTAQYFTKVDVDCVVLESYDRKTGSYNLVLSGTKSGESRVDFKDQNTNDSPITGVFDLAGDQMVGRLQRVNGLVSRSDWTSGYETCVGGGWALSLDSGNPNYQGGSRSSAEYEDCNAQLGLNFQTQMPTCESFAPGGYNHGLLPVDRTLGGDVSFQ
jgi:hypothetical protein